MKRIKILTFVLLIVISVFITYYVIRSEKIYQKEEAAGVDFNPDIYRGMARFGIGHLLDTFINNEHIKELKDYKFGWYHNWSLRKNYYITKRTDTAVNIPKSLDYYGLIGGYGPNTTNCPESLKNELKNYKDGDVIWLGNEIGWDDKRDPYTYAVQYKSWYDCIKSVNSNIKISPGANPGYPFMKYGSNSNNWVVKEDPKGRWSASQNKLINFIEYMRYVKADYKEVYSTEMPVDAYVIHIYGMEGWHDVDKLEDSIRAFRQFMKDNGQQKLPLFIKEMGILPDTESDLNKNGNTMVAILNMLLNLKDQNIGNPNDNNRLVQRWSWFVGSSSCTKESSFNSCIWGYTSFFHCQKREESDSMYWEFDCSLYRIETLLGVKYKQYVTSIWGSYDSIPPNKPDITYTINGNNALVSFNSSDNGRINNYEISVGTSEGKSDVMLWTSTDTKTNYTINNVVGKYVNVKSIDDGYNSSEVSSKKIENISAGNNNYDIAPKGSPDGKINMLDLTTVLTNWKWKKEPRDNEADVNRDGKVDILDVSIIINNWTKKY